MRRKRTPHPRTGKPIHAHYRGSRLCWNHPPPYTLLTEPRRAAKRILRRRRSASELLAEKGVRARLGGMQSVEPRAGAVDKGAGRGVLRGDAQVAGVAERVHAFARGEEGVEAGVLGVLIFLRGWGWGLRGEGEDGLEWSGGLLLGQRGQGGRARLHALVLWPVEGRGERVVGAGWGRLERFWLVLCGRSPGIVCAGLRRADLLGLELAGEVIRLLGVRVAHAVECCGLRL